MCVANGNIVVEGRQVEQLVTGLAADCCIRLNRTSAQTTLLAFGALQALARVCARLSAYRSVANQSLLATRVPEVLPLFDMTQLRVCFYFGCEN